MMKWYQNQTPVTPMRSALFISLVTLLGVPYFFGACQLPLAAPFVVAGSIMPANHFEKAVPSSEVRAWERLTPPPATVRETASHAKKLLVTEKEMGAGMIAAGRSASVRLLQFPDTVPNGENLRIKDKPSPIDEPDGLSELATVVVMTRPMVLIKARRIRFTADATRQKVELLRASNSPKVIITCPSGRYEAVAGVIHYRSAEHLLVLEDGPVIQRGRQTISTVDGKGLICIDLLTDTITSSGPIKSTSL
jgi:hypothetical protein